MTSIFILLRDYFSMPNLLADIALLTDHRYTAEVASPEDWYLANILADDTALRTELSHLGLSSMRVDWADPSVDWSRFRCAIFRTTWDYYERPKEFSAWLDRVSPMLPFYNPLSTIRWNMDKYYLSDLQSRGVDIVPCRYLEIGAECDLVGLFQETGWSEAVIKPCISGAARHTYRIRPETCHEITPLIRELLREEAFIFQPFIPDVLTNGEITVMVIDGEVTHAIQKTPRPGDFRVQDDHGGVTRSITPTQEQMDFAVKAMNAVEPRPIYGRVDMVRDHSGRWLLMELELIEPELWLRFEPRSAIPFARAIHRSLIS